jgi:ankyrin repeat protein
MRQSFVQIVMELIHRDQDQQITALMDAVGNDFSFRQHSPHIVKALLQYGADVNAKSGNGITALIWSAATGKAYNLRLLIAAGADINHKDKRGDTALNYAASIDNTDMLKTLIAAGADVSATDNTGKTALWHARAQHHLTIATMLRKAGAK